MRLRPARRLGVLTTSLLLTAGLLAPAVASAAPGAGSAATFAERGSASAAASSARASATSPIKVRDLSYACPEGRVPKAGFRDVPAGSAFSREIDCLVWYEITRGSSTPGEYKPADFVNRQQMAVFIHRLLDDLIEDMPAAPSRSRFRDVPANTEAGRAINVLASDELAELLDVRIVSGKTATTYAPGERVTRAQMGSFIARTLEGLVDILDRGRCDNVFTDERTIPATHIDNVKLLCAAGIVSGRADGSYGPAAHVTRGQMSAFLMRLMDIIVELEGTVPPDERG